MFLFKLLDVFDFTTDIAFSNPFDDVYCKIYRKSYKEEVKKTLNEITIIKAYFSN